MLSEKASCQTYTRQVRAQKKVKLGIALTKVDWEKVGKLAKKALSDFFTKENLFIYLMGFLLSRSAVLGMFPFGIAYFVAVLQYYPKRVPVVGLMVFLGTLSIGGTSKALGVLFILWGLYLALTSSTWKHKWTTFKTILVVFGAVFGIQMLINFVFMPSLYNFFRLLTEGALSAGLVFVTVQGLGMYSKMSKGQVFTGEEIVSGVIVFSALIAGVGKTNIAGYSVQNILSSWIIMVAASAGGGSVAATIGVTVGLIGNLVHGYPPINISIYTLSGLLAGIFRFFGRMGVGVGFFIGRFILSAYFNNPGEFVNGLNETLVSIALMVVFPRKLNNQIAQLIPGTGEQMRIQVTYYKKLRETISQKLSILSKMFQQLAGIMQEIPEPKRAGEQKLNLINALGQVTCAVCKQCLEYNRCWARDFYPTYKKFIDVLAYAELNGSLKGEEAEKSFLGCGKKEDLILNINHILEMHKNNYYWQKRLSGEKSLVLTQLEGVSAVMGQLAADMKVSIEYKKEIEEEIEEQLKKFDINPVDVNVNIIADDKQEIHIKKISCNGNKQDCTRIILPILNQTMHRRFNLVSSSCGMVNGKNKCTLTFSPQSRFTVVTGIAQATTKGEEISGDKFLVKPLQGGKILIVLSDGMGHGKSASVESNATINLLEQLIDAGFTQEYAIQTINTLLMLKSTSDKFATLDMVVLDLYNGEAEFYKGGCPPSFVKGEKNIQKIISPAIPIGILKNLEIDVQTITLQHNNLLVMVTDGLIETGDDRELYEEWIPMALKSVDTNNPQEIADYLLSLARIRNKGNTADDMLVVVARVDEAA